MKTISCHKKHPSQSENHKGLIAKDVLLYIIGIFQTLRGFLMFPVEGLSIKFPSAVNRDPWHGQSHECSAGLYFKAQPKCGQRGLVGVIRFATASKEFIASCGRSMLLDGEKSSVYGLLLPKTRSVRRVAATIALVIPHLLNPVAT